MSKRSFVIVAGLASLTLLLFVLAPVASGDDGSRGLPDGDEPPPALDSGNTGSDQDGPTPRTGNTPAGNTEINGSLCVGTDCTPGGITYGFDTIRLRENNLRIFFQDTSDMAGFATNDWWLEANSSESGGANYFMIRDCGPNGSVSSTCDGSNVFTVEAGAGNNALYVDNGGRVGLGTDNPVLDFHVNTSNTPGIRLEQNSGGGFTAQAWDVAGNEAGFFVRDVQAGSSLPFRIRPGAPSSSIDIAGNGDVGMGTGSPDSDLHVFGTDGGTALHVEEASTTPAVRDLLMLENNGGARVNYLNNDTGGAWVAGINFDDTFTIQSTTGTARIKFRPDGRITVADGTNVIFDLKANGDLRIDGTLTQASDAAGKFAFVPVDTAAVLETVQNLPIASWSYLDDPYWVRHLGPTAQDFYGAFGLGADDTGIAAIDSDGVALAAIQALADENDELRSRVDALEEQVAALLAALDD